MFITLPVIVCLGTKTLVVHGQNECDIPTQLPVHEDTQFEALLKVIVITIIFVQNITILSHFNNLNVFMPGVFRVLQYTRGSICELFSDG